MRKTGNGECVAGLGFIYLLHPPSEQLHCGLRPPLRCTDYTRTGKIDNSHHCQSSLFCWWQEVTGLVPVQPLPATSGYRRYNTLDFAGQNRVPKGAPRPCWIPRAKGNYPLWNPSRGSSASSGHHRHGDAVPIGFPCQQGVLTPIGNPESKGFAPL